ncbi:4Fe-4S binding protein [Halarcobacter sp.]|uniref:4Fe-4S binding protein n=1 Tax=Halarcobacter sp. TaxID=2321133 RepID=UPI002AAA6792|nr:4Fe-4S binding protein [Halarcobacter sp.]
MGVINLLYGWSIQVRIFDKCIDCGACIDICPNNVFAFINNKVYVKNEEECDANGACVRQCPVGAIIVRNKDGHYIIK